MDDGPPREAAADEISRLLCRARHDAAARVELVTLLYPELRRLAAAQMRRERRDHTLQATALVSEFFLHFAKYSGFEPETRAEFLKAAAVAMRHLLVDHARGRTRAKRGGGARRVDIEAAESVSASVDPTDVLQVDALLTELTKKDARMARVVELRFFGGLSNPEIAEVLGVHERTVKREWQMARAWLYAESRRASAHE